MLLVGPGRDRGEAALDRGHAMMAAGDTEGALRAFRQAALDGAGPDALAAMGTANLALGRLGQAEPLLRRATETDGTTEGTMAAAWNNLGVLLLETDRPEEAVESFQRAYALGDGGSDSMRGNLVLAMSRGPEASAAPPVPSPVPGASGGAREGRAVVTSAPSTEAAAPGRPAAKPAAKPAAER